MALILADVGGTNVRFATARAGVIDPKLTRRFQNDDHPSFDGALAHYVRQVGVARVEGLTAAVAGPVTGPTARLTNRDWHFDAAKLSLDYGGVNVNLMNDLSALGYALDHLSPEGLVSVLHGAAPATDHVQRLVVGVGTGFNVSPVLTRGGATRCLLAEAGLGSLPTRVMRLLEPFLQYRTDWITCVEDVFSGSGLARLHTMGRGGPLLEGRAVIENAVAGDPAARESLDVFARAFGEWVQDLRLLYLPTGGIFLAGSVVRALLDSPSRQAFIDTVQTLPTVKSLIPPVSVSLITQDEAALLGCLAYARVNV